MKPSSAKGKGRRLQNFLIPYSFECKNQERLNIWESLTQAEDNCNDYTAAVVFKRNRTKTYIALGLDEFLNIIGESND